MMRIVSSVFIEMRGNCWRGAESSSIDFCENSIGALVRIFHDIEIGFPVQIVHLGTPSDCSH